jgi:hypothetical protein
MRIELDVLRRFNHFMIELVEKKEVGLSWVSDEHAIVKKVHTSKLI